MVQSYEISERKGKKNLFSFLFRAKSKFGKAKVTKNRKQNKTNSFVFYAEME